MWSQRYSNFACRSIGPTTDGLRSISPARRGPSVSPAQGQKPSFHSLVCSPISQRDGRHFPRLRPVPAAFYSICKLLSPEAPQQKEPAKARISPKLYTKAPAKANPPLGRAVRQGQQDGKTLTT